VKEILRLCFVLTLIGAVCAAVMAFVDQETKAPIQKSQKAEKMDAVRIVMPGADNDLAKDSIVFDAGTPDSIRFYRGTKEGKLIGAAFVVVAANGYSGDIEILVGVDTAAAVTGVEILRNAETPGLGSKISTSDFRNQFVGKSLKNPEQWSVQKDGGSFKQITGATISSRAVTSAIARGLESLESHRAEVLRTPASKSGGEEKPAETKPGGTNGAGVKPGEGRM
jgi:electron transport complex protein RnfG